MAGYTRYTDRSGSLPRPEDKWSKDVGAVQSTAGSEAIARRVAMRTTYYQPRENSRGHKLDTQTYGYAARHY